MDSPTNWLAKYYSKGTLKTMGTTSASERKMDGFMSLMTIR